MVDSKIGSKPDQVVHASQRQPEVGPHFLGALIHSTGSIPRIEQIPANDFAALIEAPSKFFQRYFRACRSGAGTTTAAIGAGTLDDRCSGNRLIGRRPAVANQKNEDARKRDRGERRVQETLGQHIR
jgi:hypothetical protein